MKPVLIFLLLPLMLLVSQPAAARAKQDVQKPYQPAPLQCVAFSPYVGSLNPDYGPHPSKAQIEQLLDVVIEKTPFRCIMTYGVLNGLDVTFAAAEARGIKVIAILWLDKDTAVNSASISKGIEVAKAYPKTIIKLSCGSEVRTRHGNALDSEITRCINAMREAKITQPVTTIDTWWEWCNRATPCQQTVFANAVDWIGINVFPWWENKHAGVFSCTPAEKAADFHIARLNEIRRVYPGNEVILTEFGWPYAPEGATEVNVHTGEHCGIANRKNQALVIRTTLNKLAEKQWSGVVFEAFSENWKPSNEGLFGGSWGVCSGEPPYDCLSDLITQPKKSKRKH
ncbi:MAG: exo-beta-1,3-glucanase [Methylococcaceae bacterium]|nr:exo-beta-1,3-glucanase [Methylococcaceae bacterium]